MRIITAPRIRSTDATRPDAAVIRGAGWEGSPDSRMAVAMGANLQRRAIRTSPHRTTPRPFDGDLTGRRPAAGLGAAASEISYLLCRQQFSDARLRTVRPFGGVWIR